MKKSIKIALKRFIILFLCLLMVVTLFSVSGNKNSTVSIVVGCISLGIMVIYWIYAIISIRRSEQKKKDDNKDE